MPKKATWCVPKAGVSDAQLQANLDNACGQGIDCSPIQPGGACFEPNTIFSHAAYAMNLLYQTAGSNPWNCDFSQTAVRLFDNPSYNGCTYPGGSNETTVTPAPMPKKTTWCVPKAGVSDAQLQANLDFACGQGIDCSPIQPGGACFEPNTLFSHAAYAMNLLYQTPGSNSGNCDFAQTAVRSFDNPSYNGCTYPGGSNDVGLSQTSQVKSQTSRVKSQTSQKSMEL